MNIFQFLFDNLVYYPQLNLLYLLYSLTKDIGLSIMLVAVIVNLILWPLIVESYLSNLKMRFINPKIQEISKKYKIDMTKASSQEVIESRTKIGKETQELYKKHGIKVSTTWKVAFLQLFFASGVYYVALNVSKSGGSAINGIYPFFSNSGSFSFPDTAFNFIKIGQSAMPEYFWLPVASFVLSYLFGKYSFKWSPSAKFFKNSMVDPSSMMMGSPVMPTDGSGDVPEINMEAFQKFNERLIIYGFPLMSLFINSTFFAGVNLYFVTLSLFNLLRQIIIHQYYASHTDELYQQLAESDPMSDDGNKDNDQNSPVDVSVMATGAVAASAQKKNKKKNKK
jgi:YidC/Oxa1 family membrane protein insertase